MNAAVFRAKFTRGFKASQSFGCSRVSPSALDAEHDHQRRRVQQVTRLGLEVVGAFDDPAGIIRAVFGGQATLAALGMMIRATENFPSAVQCGREPEGRQ